MRTVEDAYHLIASALLQSAGAEWDKLTFNAALLAKSCSNMQTVCFLDDANHSIALGFKNGFIVSDAAIFLRDDLLKTTGHRAWGLTYTLLPSGKMNIEYSYDKPEDYDGD